MKFNSLGLAAGIGVVLLLAVGCSFEKEERDYSIPVKICDVAVEESMVKPLLPPGGSLKEGRQSMGRTPGEGEQCTLDVDKKIGLTIKISRQFKGRVDALEAVDRFSNLKRIPLGGNFTSAAVADDGAVAWLQCIPKSGQHLTESAAGVKYKALVLELFVENGGEGPENTEQQHKDIDKFVRSYVPGVEKLWCE
ncbi:hypothetical protein K4749_34380 [Streptomyces sp. TRM72054]|uniref:hypothetical protein n=1 Tax=Streptomyces sp. TRM72054 TaxID=2870562 RepID=UPI001C8B73E4|nr:hypothetical protein [Streptomyces sp. TRM72054]MBX9398534.1 hypothetical protein [Streptomyces sp. TRM72054]